VAAAGLAAAEALRYVRAGRWPAGWGPRAMLAVLVAVVVAALKVRGWLRLDASSHGWACLWLGLFAALWLVRAYRRTTRAIGRRVRLTLLALRMAAGFLILLLLAGPVLQTVHVRRERAVLGILLDDSRSMTVRDVLEEDGSDAISRLEAVTAVLGRSQEALTRMGDELQVRWFTFDAGVRETASVSLAGKGEFTALADAVGRVHVLLGQAGRKVGGIIVVSDGRDNFSTDAEPLPVSELLAAAGVPLYAAGVGSDTPLGRVSGLQARRLDCPNRVAVLNRLGVHAEFFAAGLADTPIDVELLVDDELVDQCQVRPAAMRELISVDLSHVPDAGGLHRVTARARAASIPGERGEASLSQFVRVSDDKLRVLYIDRARYERAAIARALESAKELRVHKVDLNQPAGTGPSPRLSGGADQWKAYHVVLIGDVDREGFPPGSLEALRKRVTDHGCGLAMLGGVRTLGSGRYHGTAVDALVPVDLGIVGQLPGPTSLELTPAGRLHPICRLAEDPGASEAMWQRLPPLTGASRLGRAGPAAEVLIRSEDAQPLLVVQEAGKGRTAVVAFDSTWQWSFADEHGGQARRRFWRQLVLWLANRRPDVWVTTDKPRYDLFRLRTGKDRVLIRAGATDPATGEMPEGVTLTGTMTGPEGESGPIRWVTRPEGLEAEPSIERAGEYRVTITARSGDEPLAESETAFVVTSIDVELADALADLETLKRMAERTERVGGRYVPVEQFSRLLEDIHAAGPVTEIAHVRRQHLRDEWAWEWLAVFLALVTVEWIARRRAGLV